MLFSINAQIVHHLIISMLNYHLSLLPFPYVVAQAGIFSFKHPLSFTSLSYFFTVKWLICASLSPVWSSFHVFIQSRFYLVFTTPLVFLQHRPPVFSFHVGFLCPPSLLWLLCVSSSLRLCFLCFSSRRPPVFPVAKSCRVSRVFPYEILLCFPLRNTPVFPLRNTPVFPLMKYSRVSPTKYSRVSPTKYSRVSPTNRRKHGLLFLHMQLIWCLHTLPPVQFIPINIAPFVRHLCADNYSRKSCFCRAVNQPLPGIAIRYPFSADINLSFLLSPKQVCFSSINGFPMRLLQLPKAGCNLWRIIGRQI